MTAHATHEWGHHDEQLVIVRLERYDEPTLVLTFVHGEVEHPCVVVLSLLSCVRDDTRQVVEPTEEERAYATEVAINAVLCRFCSIYADLD